MKLFLKVLLLVAFSCTFALGQGEQSARPEAGNWITVAPDNADFSVLMPLKPTEKIEPVKGSTSENRTFSLETDLAGYIVSYVQFSSDITDEQDVKKILDGGREGGLSATGGKLKSEKEIKLKEYPGREWLVDLPGGFSATSRTYWIKRRLYQLVFVVQPKANDDEALIGLRQNAVNKFFNSFSVSVDAK